MYKFLLIEDSDTDIEACLTTVKRMNIQRSGKTIHVTPANTFNKGINELGNHYSGIIVDIRLDNNNNGNDIIKKICEEYRVPVAILTGTPDIELPETSPVKVYKKGETTYEEILNSLIKILDTGIFNVLGGKGILETLLNQIFWQNIYPQIEIWEKYYEEDVETEKVLLRYSIAHIQEVIGTQLPYYQTEETYIKPPISAEIKTGCIFQSITDKKYYIVLSPPCDLAVHNGKMKTDRILVCQIDDLEEVNEYITAGVVKTNKKQKMIETAIKNNYTDYYHWLPNNSLFKGGYINFRNVITHDPGKFSNEFGIPVVKVQDFFVKNILNRFSAYYARQGQPDFNFNVEAERIITTMCSNS